MFKANAKVDVALNRDVEHLIKTGGKEGILPIVQMGEPVLRQRTVPYEGQLSRRTLTKLIETMRTSIFQHETDHLSGEVYIDRAEIRSLSSDENLADLWCEDPVPTEAAEELGFDL